MPRRATYFLVLTLHFALLSITGYMNPVAFGQEAPPLLICVVEIPKDNGFAQTTGRVARELSAELSRRKLQNGGSIQPILVVAEKKTAEVSVERSGCTFRIDLEWHYAIRPSEGMPADVEGAEAETFRDSDVIMFTLRRTGSRKSILSGSVRPTTWRGRSDHPSFVSYIEIANRVIKKLSRVDGH
ncbi:MAG TPA: hypothetical protein VK574_16695 [Terracidiphilus sp.]|nr:hypothetical protein [Terracidiphilus sp.]